MLETRYQTIRLFDLPVSERPRERLIKHGVENLSNVELLSLVLRSGGRNVTVKVLAENLLKTFKNYRGIMLADTAELIGFNDIGLAKATSLKAACEIGIRMTAELEPLSSVVVTPADIYKILRKTLYAKTKEHLYVVSLDARLRVLSIDLVSIGTANEALAHPREIYSTAIKKGAVSVVLVHNHPSNDPTPSSADIELTQRVAEAGVVLGIKLQDHVVMGDDSYVSLREQGLLVKN